MRMSRQEIAACFDKAFEHMFAGDFVRAAACFRHVIERSGAMSAWCQRCLTGQRSGSMSGASISSDPSATSRRGISVKVAS